MKKKLKYYHTSGTRFKVGDVIGGPGKVVCLHTNPVPHGTIQCLISSGYGSYKEHSEASIKDSNEHWDNVEKWIENGKEGERPQRKDTKNPKPVKLFVYEMEPFKKPTWVGVNDEYRAYDTFVEVVRVVGNAKGILDNFRQKFGDTEKAWHFGGKALKKKK